MPRRDNVYEVTVVAADDQGLTDSVAVTVTVSDHGEGPVVSGRQSLSFTENQATDEILATYDAADPDDPSGPITRWGLSGTDAGDFAVSDTGELSFRKAPDYERPADSNKDNVYSLSVRASDGRNYGYLAVTVTVENINEAPEITTTAKTAFAYRENGTAAVYTFSAADPERAVVVWSAGGTDGGIFAVTRDSRGRGVLSFANIPDFESPADAGRDNVYEVTVVAADDQGLNAGTLAVTVTVTDVNEGPEVSGLQSLSFAENQATDQILATYGASDPEDPSGPITRWGLSGTDAGDFAVSETGELSFRKVPDFERPADSNRDNVYSLSVRASDGRSYGYLAVTVDRRRRQRGARDHHDRQDRVRLPRERHRGGVHLQRRRPRTRRCRLVGGGSRQRDLRRHPRQPRTRRADLRRSAQFREPGRCRPRQRL